MRSFEFSEEQLNNLQDIGQALFCDEKDPRSPAYKRVLVRPKINWIKICLFVFLPLILLFGCIILLKNSDIPFPILIPGAIAIYLIYSIIMAKKAIICAVKIYQRYAPDKVRNKCRFEPSCSEYMILSLEKYGLFKGLKKGIGRLRRCNVKGGGFDYP